MSDDTRWRIERVDRPAPGLFTLCVSRRRERAVWLLGAGPPRARADWAIVGDRPRGEPADAHVRALRARLEGAHVLELFERRGELRARLSRGAERAWLVADARRGLVVDDGAPDGGAPGDRVDDAAEGRARVRGAGFVEDHERQRASDARRAARAALAKARSRMARRVEAIEGDGRAVLDAERAADRARLFVPAAARAPRGATSIVAIDHSSGAPAEISFTLTQDRGAREQLDAVFARAKRLRAGHRIVEARLREALAAVAALDDALAALDAAGTVAEVEALLSRVPGAVPLAARPRPRVDAATRARATELPRGVRAFTASSGETILVGKDAASNDALTTKVARPGDLWLHARGVVGAHVVVPRWYASGRVDAESLVDAATLAAHFSDARGDAVIDVAYADRRFVTKPRGAAPGAVTLLRERVLPVRAEPARLARLLR